jgi:hypothetical protein
MINKLINLANYLDELGFYREADQVASLIKHSAIPIVAPTAQQAVDENGCINWGVWGGDPWALANDILKKMKATLGPKGYLEDLASYADLMKNAGLEPKGLYDLGLITDFSVWSTQHHQASLGEIKKSERELAVATYEGDSLLGKQLHIGLHKDFFTSYCTKSVDELAVIIGHELSHHILDTVKNYSDIARNLAPEIDKLRNNKGELELTDKDGNAFTIDAIDLSIDLSSGETEADLLGKYLAEKIGYPNGDAGVWIRRNTEDVDASKIIGDELEAAQTHPSSSVRGDPNLWSEDDEPK